MEHAINPGEVAVVLFVLTSLGTLLPAKRLFQTRWAIRSPHQDERRYEDADGTATKESMAQFSNKHQFLAMLGLALCGFGLAFANLVYAATNAGEGTSFDQKGAIWLLAPAWVLLLVQLVETTRQTGPVARFQSALWKQAPAIFIGGIAYTALPRYDGSYSNGFVVTTALVGLQLGALLALLAIIWFVKCRPAVFGPDGRMVDEEMNGGLWTRYGFGWASTILALGGKEKLNDTDLPAMNHSVRSKDVTDSFSTQALQSSTPLWIRIAWQFRGQLIRQWLSILFSNFFDVAPAFANLQLLQFLETRGASDQEGLTAWKYVVAIALATASSSLVDSRIIWWAGGYIAPPLRSTLTGLMYTKLLRMKSSSGPSKIDEETGDEGDQEGPSKSQQDVINMFAVDCNQVAIFSIESSQYVNLMGKMMISIVFLWLLIGWQSLCAGLLGMMILFPINQSLARRYGKKQKLLMKVRDKRAAMTTEAMHGIRQIKFSAAENQWAAKLEAVRDEELAMLWSTRLNNLYMTIGSEFTPVVLTALSLTTYSYIYGTLLPSVAFTSISVFLHLEGIVSQIPYLLVTALTAKVSCDRLDKFFRTPEREDNTHPGEAVSFHNASVSFPYDSLDPPADQFTLRNLNLAFPNNALSIISGPTGSGKSLLLAAILGEIEVLEGYIHVPRDAVPQERFDSKATAANWLLPTALAFVSQTPWIENATIKNSILFGLPFDAIRYAQVIHACALTADLALFEDGDETEVGAQGISLSGGQKWRLALARALYSRAGILVLDDVFSALDAHVGKHVYEHAVMGQLGEGRTRILATHHVSLCLSGAKYAVGLAANGTLQHAGLVDQLQAEGQLDLTFDTEDREILIEDEDSSASDTAVPSTEATLVPRAPPKKLIQDEKRETGRVRTSVYSGYLDACGGWPFWIFLCILFAASQTFTVGRTYWVRIWANTFGEPEASQYAACHYHNTLQTQLTSSSAHTLCSATSSIEIQHRSLWFYLGIYCLISVISVALSVGRLFMIYTGSIRASRTLFRGMLNSVLRAPLRWLDTVPTGRVLNRFTGDFSMVDSNLAEVFYSFAGSLGEVVGILGAAIVISPFMVLVALGLLVVCGIYARSYVGAARNVKRLESNSRSPVISHFSASLSGLSTIRAFAASSDFTRRMYGLLDTYAACTWYDRLLSSWLHLRISMVASLFPAAVATFVVTSRTIDASLAGFALSFSLSFGWTIRWAIRIATRVELSMNATERIFEYRDLQIEPQDGKPVRASWPENGRIEVDNIEVGYAEGLPSILKGLTFTAEPNQRIGVVGRTGAGKSTLSLALFRFLDTRRGSIMIDGVDISKIKLQDLRTRLAIIPQDPVLFSGTIRTNLDPLNQFTDAQVREALARVHLIPSEANSPLATPGMATPVTETPGGGNTNIFLSLSSPISTGGANLSQGQKQLLCLARAILSRPKILILDEATSAVDMATDLLIQRSIREAFSNTTLLVVAHRLSTVADFDRILVMKDGAAAEFGTPGDLVKTDEGIFQDMVNKSGEAERLKSMMA
ncbi:P-loop containing nucleoside triphosphate hydrolase protein [Aspergillus ellipticus CBS 707.79]|uniref:P-loop containing nucleoside triphosphate hydrolase protein n=1 Tax=Aspergillus ellipticus CBS 707.79 TaxID=1448320 RepID=A0A319D1P9_9EURO|nr:P-loop containing nucleoside triphosphate hydrolase protein [Aspergillus ellipticus CBS 707.79]